MESIKFDFNNLFSFNIGSEQGVEDKDIREISATARQAHKHLAKLLQDSRSRIKLGLEWVKLPEQNRTVIKQIQKWGREISQKYDAVISLGIGGSYLGLRAAQDALCPPYFNEFKPLRKKSPRIYFEGNNLDPDPLAVLLKNLQARKTALVVISKSGQTIETRAAFLAVEDWLKAAVGKNYGRQIFVVTDPSCGSLRQKVNAEQLKDALSFRSLPLLKGVGGRFSELNMGLLHLAILGIDIQQVLDGAKEMRQRCLREDILGNPAYLYAILHTILYRKKNKPIAILMPFSETLKATADWYVQLLSESLGKKFSRKIDFAADGTEDWLRGEVVNVGRTPVSSRGTNDLHSIQQNNIEGENTKVITFLRVERFSYEVKVPGKNDILSGRRFSELLKLAQQATEWALVREERPNCTIILPKVSPYYWGALLFFFEMATAFEAELLNVNAFDQPGVESYKNYLYYQLGTPNIPEAIAERIKTTPLIKDPKYIL